MNIHLILQGKGGVGKSYIASIIAQFCNTKGTTLAIDTDPVNATFAGYEGLNVERADIMDGDDINPRRFDALMETIFNANCDDVIIDNGASSFLPLLSYLISNGVIDLFKEYGHTPVIHTVITGGQAQIDTLAGFVKLLDHFGQNGEKLVVWLNEYWGEVVDRNIPFDRMPVYKHNQDKVKAIITIPDLKHETFGEDVAQMLKARQTFDEAISSDTFNFMARQRLMKVKNHLFDAMQTHLAEV
ncbi:CobQ/CobB/MinD/ParA nucleotide binding domain-containing protein [Alteromonadaceae bacterium 2753L.S.0a.02]|nr:CobQ/CobB/MinD/ParA nucleotide binding domain-containing protein [Alteromonadaceae bacterium 2753L.S.0a.02]